jgi:hypothetical protein
MTHPVYTYPYGTPFAFVKLGNIEDNEGTDLPHYYCVVYNNTAHRIMAISAFDAESCTIERYVDDQTLSRKLFDCLDMNMGYYLLSEDTFKDYLKHHIKCRNMLIEFLAPLMKREWTLDDLKETYRLLQRAFLKTAIEDRAPYTLLDEKLKTILDERLLEESNAKIIQKHWRHVVSNPQYACCQRRLVREFQDMQNEQYI